MTGPEDRPPPGPGRAKELADDLAEDSLLDQIASLNAARFQASRSGDTDRALALTAEIRDLRQQYLALRTSR